MAHLWMFLAFALLRREAFSLQTMLSRIEIAPQSPEREYPADITSRPVMIYTVVMTDESSVMIA
jgi:hypothetical protein